jgi:hypothetical protein
MSSSGFLCLFLTCGQYIVESLFEQASFAYKAFRSGNWPLKQSSDTRKQADAPVLHLAGASNLHATISGASMDNRTPTSASSSAGTPPALQSENIHPTLFEYFQVIQRGDTDVKEGPDICTTESTSSEKLNGFAANGHRTEMTTASALNSLGTSDIATTGPSASSSLPPLFQTLASGPSWLGFEAPQSSFAHRSAVQSIDPPVDSVSAFSSLFRFDNPLLFTQYPQSTNGTSESQRVSTLEPSVTPEDTSGGFGIDAVQMGDLNADAGMDFARFMAENVPGLAYDGNGIDWDTVLTGWQAQF